ncbi:hypothetical protein [Roseomonas populi]|uniref:Twin-arginine translocation signal domain-containing protein n=1 Tax=Roseomonas populi TaxID=3121582 RepID=A0ABT1XCK2_9PROT|nr:hypothetical protein [Roseomonas pecuniae]MCR0985866.1 hypothetical protein [Roseomonas pecuniae]
MSRRSILAGVAAVAGAGIAGEGAPALSLPANDARLLALKAALARAGQWHELCAIDAGRDFTSSEAQAVAEAAQESALDAWEAVLFQMAETPAAGMVGVAVKAEQVALAVRGIGRRREGLGREPARRLGAAGAGGGGVTANSQPEPPLIP